ncbi:MAG: IS4 family transposase [Hyphomicrobiaceae bacterium]|nr:IS4 family transposase [Hyphomicrobiaceae bacterium]
MRTASPTKDEACAFDGNIDTWVEEECSASLFKDVRLKRRFVTLLNSIGRTIGGSIPFVCQDWANTKAAYRFLSNDRVSEADILAGHLSATRDRFSATDGLVLVLHDTTEFSYQRESPHAIGLTKAINSGRDKAGRLRTHTVCGLLMHSSLAVTVSGLPLGLAAIKFWTRKKFKGTKELKRKVNPTRIPIEEKESYRWLENVKQSTDLLADPERCIHIGDRESDIFELFCAVQDSGTHFLVRTCVDRLAGDGTHTVADAMKEVRLKGVHRIEVRDDKGDINVAELEIRYARIRVLPPIGKQKHYPPQELIVIHARERGSPKNRKAIDWKLLTNLPVSSRKEAIEKLDWYSMRWKIETFHKILKSGCRAEDAKLRTAERLTNLIALYCIVSWRVFWLTMLARTAPQAPARVALTDAEIYLLDHMIKDAGEKTGSKTLARYLIKLARLGGYLARAKDPPPGNLVIWRGLSRLADIQIGADITARNCG